MDVKFNTDPNAPERRVFKIELREESPGEEGNGGSAAASSRTVVGYAAVFNVETELWKGYRETIEKGAFAECIATSDIRALFNHDANLVLARSTSGTLKVSEDDKGLRYEFDLPDTTYGNDLLVSLKRKDVTQSSFAFSILEQSVDRIEGPDGEVVYTRRIKKVKELYDVSPVTYPAYCETEANLEARYKQKNGEFTHSDAAERSQWDDFFQAAKEFLANK